jgi:hypothetical protein
MTVKYRGDDDEVYPLLVCEVNADGTVTGTFPLFMGEDAGDVKTARAEDVKQDDRGAPNTWSFYPV